MSPMEECIRLVRPAAEAMKTHFSHMSCAMVSLAVAAKFAPANWAAMASMRGERPPARSP
ncbi:hypothetical protein D9M69_686200 [compost metagenome]